MTDETQSADVGDLARCPGCGMVDLRCERLIQRTGHACCHDCPSGLGPPAPLTGTPESK